MNRLNLLMLLPFLAIAGVSIPLFWTNEKEPEEIGALADFHDLVEPLPRCPPAEASPENEIKPEFELDLRVLRVFLTGKKSFGLSENAGNLLCAGRLKHGDTESVEKMLQDCSQISRPVIQTANGQMGILEIGQNTPLVSGSYYFIERPPVGASIQITPRLQDRTDLIIDVNASISKRNDLGIYLTTAADSIRVRVQLGDTLVMGGLKQKVTYHRTSDIPVLSELPFVGSWFTYDHDETVEEELLIAVTPRPARRLTI